MDCLVTLDAGTGSGRCMAFDAAGRVLASAQEPFAYRLFEHPQLPMVRGCDLDADAFWPFVDVIGGSRWPGYRGGPKGAGHGRHH